MFALTHDSSEVVLLRPPRCSPVNQEDCLVWLYRGEGSGGGEAAGRDDCEGNGRGEDNHR